MTHMNDAVDRTRRVEQRELKALGDDRLTGTKYVWGTTARRRCQPSHRDRLALLTAPGMMRKLKTTRAWSIKESLRDLWKCRSRVEAERDWRWWYGLAGPSAAASVT